MAIRLRDVHNLTTLHCWLELRSGPASPTADRRPAASRVVMTQLFVGRQQAGPPVETPAEMLGLGSGETRRTAITADAFAATAISAQIRDAAAMVDDGVLWFFIPQDAYELALLPWEDVAHGEARLTLLRIANFFEDPYAPVPAPVIAICASQPLADGHYPVPHYVTALLRSINLAAAEAKVRPKVTIFTDTNWHQPVESEVQALVGGGRLANLDVAPMPLFTDADAPPPERRGTATGAAVSAPCSPWLRWMTGHFAGKAVDAVHFISPGYFHENRGAVALSQRPDCPSHGGDFVGADDLACFYDQLGCSVMGFSSPDMPMWEWGQRMLAFELSWLRAGPILVFEKGLAGYSALARIYSVILGADFHGRRHWPFGEVPIHLCCHPNMLDARPDIIIESPAIDAAFKLDPSSQEFDSAWSVNDRAVEIVRAQLSPMRDLLETEKWESQGASQALDFLSGLSNLR